MTIDSALRARIKTVHLTQFMGLELGQTKPGENLPEREPEGQIALAGYKTAGYDFPFSIAENSRMRSLETLIQTDWDTLPYLLAYRAQTMSDRMPFNEYAFGEHYGASTISLFGHLSDTPSWNEYLNNLEAFGKYIRLPEAIKLASEQAKEDSLRFPEQPIILGRGDQSLDV
ncbi:hypothetical protein AVEN_150616-1 [Araneus ventricosus]|uniref:Uncharacterized protein n=1 Tax=Araneus ventricosus TaxID=182803 RepID=A0A4Y2VEA3_ARAVE|nr:hypothetical protein AVEN_150616-1 [Araneus ventricosus]